MMDRKCLKMFQLFQHFKKESGNIISKQVRFQTKLIFWKNLQKSFPVWWWGLNLFSLQCKPSTYFQKNWRTRKELDQDSGAILLRKCAAPRWSRWSGARVPMPRMRSKLQVFNQPLSNGGMIRRSNFMRSKFTFSWGRNYFRSWDQIFSHF